MNLCKKTLIAAMLTLCVSAGAIAADAPGAPALKPDLKAAASFKKTAEQIRSDAEKLVSQNEKADPLVRAAADYVAMRMRERAETTDKMAEASTIGDAAVVNSLQDQANQQALVVNTIRDAPSNRSSQLQMASEDQFTNWQNSYPQAIDLLKVYIDARKKAAQKYGALVDLQLSDKFNREAIYKAADDARQAAGEVEVAQVTWMRLGSVRKETESAKKAGLSSAKMQILTDAEQNAKDLIEAVRARQEAGLRMQQLSRDVPRHITGDTPKN